ncbi:MAG: transposase [Deltaproteobacteria bacterium]|nr:transposase [Deltaproteobacteria bacterium]
MLTRKSYSGSFKAKVITDLILGKKKVDELAEAYQVHPNQIKNWKSLLFKRAHLVFDDRRHIRKNNHNEFQWKKT